MAKAREGVAGINDNAVGGIDVPGLARYRRRGVFRRGSSRAVKSDGNCLVRSSPLET